MRFKTTLVILAFFCIANNVTAQQNTTSSGGDGSGTGGSVAYSIGQIDYITLTGTGGNANAGVEQPFEILTTAVSDITHNISLSAFPNPVLHSLTLKTELSQGEILTYELFNAEGRLLISKAVSSSETIIDMSAYPAATYILNVKKENNKLSTHKIIKK